MSLPPDHYLPSVPPVKTKNMSTFNVKEDQNSVQTVAEFDALLERYKKQSPEKYAAKEANGEFERFRKTLIDYMAPTETPKVAKTKTK